MFCLLLSYNCFCFKTDIFIFLIDVWYGPRLMEKKQQRTRVVHHLFDDMSQWDVASLQTRNGDGKGMGFAHWLTQNSSFHFISRPLLLNCFSSFGNWFWFFLWLEVKRSVLQLNDNCSSQHVLLDIEEDEDTSKENKACGGFASQKECKKNGKRNRSL